MQGQAVGLGAAASEDDLARLGADQFGHLPRARVSIASRASRPSWCKLEDCPRSAPRYGAAASSTRGSGGVVAALSK